VYPVFEAIDIGSLTRIRPEPLRDPRFVLDVHLGRLSAYLRMAGFDVHYSNEATDSALAALSATEHRILLTRDQHLLKRKQVTHAYWVRSLQPRAQLQEVVRRFDLARLVTPFTRCLRCNTPLVAAPAALIARQAPARVRSKQEQFRCCPSCGRLYWKGTHYARMRDVLAAAVGAGGRGSETTAPPRASDHD
jgi:uncharacterized protein with PIN domain